MKKIYKIRDGKKICGVCGGIGEYLGIDATLVRLIWALFILLAGTGILAYFIAALIIPYEDEI